MRRVLLILFSQIIIIQLFSQQDSPFHPPVKIPMYLSGNFGEIRSDHFHSGIDIKTQGTIGHHVFSIEDGYVSRIKVQANGYGKSIYISHPSGYTSVYGHLDRYREDIAKYVNQIQYKRRSHQVDIYMDPDRFKLEKGDFIAYAGNSGSSSGPHLHFEVRTSGNQHPTNALNYGFDIKDGRAPRFHKLIIYPADRNGAVNGSTEKLITQLVPDQGVYTIPYGTKLSASGKLGVAVEVFDYLDGVSNRCGVYTLEMFIDDKKVYGHTMDEFSFSETRYINAHIEYGERINNSTKAHRLHRLPNNRLRIYEKLGQDGTINILEDRAYRIRIVATDVAGNSSEAVFSVAGDPGSVPGTEPPVTPGNPMKYQEPNQFRLGKVKVEIPANALYQDLDFQFRTSPPQAGSLTEFFHIHSAEVPVHLPYTLSINAGGIDPSFNNKLLLVTEGDEHELVSAGGEYVDGHVVASLRTFGNFAISMDTIAPEIVPLNGSKTGDMANKKAIKFTIRDAMSGIDKYEGYVDNRWALFEYDPKNDLLLYQFDGEKISRDSTHELELYVSDEKGNVNLFHTTFTW